MGTDISNDALINAGNLTVDYTPKLAGSKSIDGEDCWIIELTPRQMPVVLGKIAYIHKKSFVQLGGEFYDEDDFLITENESIGITNFDGRKLPKVIKWCRPKSLRITQKFATNMLISLRPFQTVSLPRPTSKT